VITWYRSGRACQVTLIPTEGSPEHLPFARNGKLEVDLAGHRIRDIRCLMVDWPSAHLEGMTLIDTPGLASLTLERSRRSEAFLAHSRSDDPPADAVVYLMRHLHAADARALEAFHDRAIANPTPLNALGVLARADEIGVARIDAMESARNIASLYSRDPVVRRLCQMVLPVCGLLAQGAATLREDEFRDLRTLAQLPAEECADLLLSIHHFTRDAGGLPIESMARVALLDRLGLFGVRVSVEFLRSHADSSADDLVEHLEAQSGIRELQDAIQTQFAERSSLLKAHSVLNALDHWLQGRGDDGRAWALKKSVERVRSEAHEFEELRLYTEIRAGTIPVSDVELEELDALFRGADAAVRARLRLGAGAPAAAIRELAMARVEYWQRRAENPLTPRKTADASRVIVRSYEGILAESGATPYRASS
jgi:hypothetical protein